VFPLPTREGFRHAFGKTPTGRAARAARLRRAHVHRGLLETTCFVGVTGSSGKTTTKELIAAVLSTRLRGTKSPGTWNTIEIAAGTILRTQTRDDFAAVEMAAGWPGSIAEAAALVRPDIAVVTTVGREHQKAFGSVEAVGAEKRALVEAAANAAILNADDPLVLAMRDASRGPVITVGESAGATFRATNVAGIWPERLTFTLSYGGRSVPVSTRLCGAHWTPAVLAALAVGVQLGIPLETAVSAIESFEPIGGRLSPVVCGGVTFIRDDWKAPQWSVSLAIDFMAAARAERKVIVIGWISNYAEPLTAVYARVAQEALAAADEVALVGALASSAELAVDERLRHFPTVRDAARYFEATLRAGDLVLLKGIDDHLQRIILTRQTTVRCWRERCGRRVFCDACYLRRLPARPGAPRRGDDSLSRVRL
jgi:UDP-N-acetylmuramoyl-tripeptide--D-alanyl-D-alanine ligase